MQFVVGDVEGGPEEGAVDGALLAVGDPDGALLTLGDILGLAEGEELGLLETDGAELTDGAALGVTLGALLGASPKQSNRKSFLSSSFIPFICSL